MVVVVTAAVASPAAAQVPGLVIEPDSPSAKEYALPFENERRMADPATPVDAPVSAGERSSPAFGAGVTADEPDGAATAREGSTNPAGGGDAGGGGGQGSGGDGAGEVAPVPRTDAGVEETVRAATAEPGAPGGAGSTLSVIGIALAVLLAAGGAGLALRRRAG
jgi:hypothetical protein